jgi:hypothetical protein
MTRAAIIFFSSFLIFIMNVPNESWSQKADPTILDFRVQALYRAAKLTWKVKDGFKGGLAVQILRADTFEEGPYKEVDTVHLTPGKSTFEYVDKTMGAEAKYYYKLFIKENDESFGPIPTRPFFSPPATHHQPPVPVQRSSYALSLLSSASKS